MRLRFAPSPTGALTLGNARTAIINWLEARRLGGRLVLRIEDTDASRSDARNEAAILEDLRWLGLEWDEGPDVGGPYGPYRQSERRERYRSVVARLVEQGAAYPCFCDATRLRAAREDARARGESYRYAGTCRRLDQTASARRLAEGERAAVRFRLAHEPGEIAFEDGLRGHVGVDSSQLDDFVMARDDGLPVYQLAVVVDDHDMAIDHVVRGQDHLSNTPRQLLLYRALGWSEPRFTHLPLVLGADRARLSKRHGAVSVAEARAAGILGEALFNYLVLLGWAPPAEEEILDVPRILAAWRLEQMAPSNVGFDPAKLEWVNQQHMARLDPGELLARAAPFLEAAGHVLPGSPEGRGWWGRVLQLLVPAVHRLAQLPEAVEPLFRPAAVPRGELSGPAVEAVLAALVDASGAGPLTTDEAFRDAARAAGRRAGVGGRELFHPIRLALTGRDSGPELARLVPLIEEGSRLGLEPPVPSIQARVQQAVAR